MTMNDHVKEVREQMERHWTHSEIAHKCGITLALVQEIIKQLEQTR